MEPLKISANCEQLYFNLKVPNVINAAGTLIITNGDNTQSSFEVFIAGGMLTLNINLKTKGVIKYQVVVNENTVYTGFDVATCEIDCCIAKLTESGINCTCKCDKCKEELLRAEKIMLLLKASQYAASVEVNYDDAVAKYNKAKEFCTEVCACGC